MNYYSLPNSHQIPPQPTNSHGEKANSNSYDSMFSFFTIPVPPTQDHIPKANKPATQQIREGEKYFVLTSDLLKLKQSDAAARLDIHPSTFSKKWRQSLPDRKWPYRKHCKIERQIKKLKEHADSMSEGQLKELVNMREKNLEPAVIVISDSDTTTQLQTKPTNTPQSTTTPNTTTSNTTTFNTSTPNTTTPNTTTFNTTPIMPNTTATPISATTHPTTATITTTATPVMPNSSPMIALTNASLIAEAALPSLPADPQIQPNLPIVVDGVSSSSSSPPSSAPQTLP